ncbi:MAG TPA: ABC transporter substrate-binding protein [Candidatus Binatus sp.]|nr:ABC transporter substrate-binding protein [Candidatus Binatus sp.]
MHRRFKNAILDLRWLFLVLAWITLADLAAAADKLVALYSSHAVPYSMPWVAEEMGLFKKHDIDFAFVYIPSSSTATAALLGSNVEVGLLGGMGIVNAYASGANDLVFIGSIKNIMTQSILAKPEITKLEQLRGKRVGVTRIGSNTHFFTVQVFRRAGMNPDKDFTFIQTGGDNETLGALVSGRIDAAAMLPPTDGRAIALGFRYVVFGPDIGIPYAASTITTRRSVIAKRGAVVGRFMRAMAEASRAMHRDKEMVYRVLEKKLRIKDRAVLDASYAIEMKVMEPRLELKATAIQPMIDEVAKTNSKAADIKPQELMDRRYLVDMENSGFFNQVWAR